MIASMTPTMPTVAHRLETVWEVYAENSEEYLGCVRRVQRSGAPVYQPERPDGIAVIPANSGRRPGWPDKNAAAAALANSYISNPA